MSIKKYTIGQMARLCNLTTKQLRHYDETMILCPAYKDNKTNYRYYGENQLEELFLIKELREIGVPLKKIKYLLSQRNLSSLRQELDNNIFQARNELHEAQKKYDKTIEIYIRVISALECLQTYSDNKQTPYDIQMITFPVRMIVFTRYKCYWNAQKLFIGRRSELYALIDQYDLTSDGPNMAIFHDDYLKQFSNKQEDCEGDLEICISVKSIKSHCPHCRTIGGWQAISMIHIGHYRHMRPAYEALEFYARERGLALAGTSLEEYIVGASMTSNEANYVTRIYLPLAATEI